MKKFTFHSYTVQTTYGKIHTLEAGQGKPLIFFHGWSSNAYLYTRVLEVLSKKYRIILPTLPGAYPSFSWKGKPARDTITDALSQWFESLRISSCTVIGHSLGGIHAILLASRIPKHIQHLFLLDSAGVPIIRTPKEWRDAWFFKRKRFIQDHGFAVVAKDFIQGFLFQFFTHRKDLIALSKIARHDDIRDIAKNLSVPTTIVWGSNDYFIPQDIGKELQKATPNSHFHVVDGDHEWPVYAPELLLPILSKNNI